MLTHNTLTTKNFFSFIPKLQSYDPRILERVDTEGRYEPVLRRQAADLKDFHADESLELDPNLDYTDVVGLSEEVRERLRLVRPVTIVRLLSRALFFSIPLLIVT
jgi:tRNA uridine 5-carboxymethylaminomethyl modification enzyme